MANDSRERIFPPSIRFVSFDFVQRARRKITMKLCCKMLLNKQNIKKMEEEEEEEADCCVRSLFIDSQDISESSALTSSSTRGHNKFKCRRNEIKQTHSSLSPYIVHTNCFLFGILRVLFAVRSEFYILQLLLLLLLLLPFVFFFFLLHCRYRFTVVVFYFLACRVFHARHSNKLLCAYFLTISSEI